jgi:transcriptional regulator with XRE-family HTH domain
MAGTERGELTALLRYCRARIDPADAGLSHRGGRGRRALGLSQAQVAQLLFLTERWYGQFERGGIDAPSPALLEDVARVLRMSGPERSALYLYALGLEPEASSPGDELGSGMPWELMLDEVTPHPVAVTDVAWNVIAHNGGFTDFRRAIRAGSDFNLLRWQLLAEEARDSQLLDWEAGWARTAAARLRQSLARHPNNDQLRRIERDVLADPRARPVYQELSRAFEPGHDAHPIRLPGWGSGQLAILSMHPYGEHLTLMNILMLQRVAVSPAPSPPPR